MTIQKNLYHKQDGIIYHTSDNRGLLSIIGKTVNAIVISTVDKQDLIYAQLVNDWILIIGIEIASNTRPYKIVFVGEKKFILYILVDNANSLNISYKTHEIQSKINSYFGEERIKKIIYKNGLDKMI